MYLILIIRHRRPPTTYQVLVDQLLVQTSLTAPQNQLLQPTVTLRSAQQSACSNREKKSRTVTNLAKPRSSPIMVRPARQRLVCGCSPLKVVDLCRSSKRLCQNASTASFKPNQNLRKGKNQTCLNTPSSSTLRSAGLGFGCHLIHRRPPTMHSLILIRRHGWSGRIAS